MAPSLPVAAAAAFAATAGTVLAGRELDKTYNIRSDLAQIRAARKSRKHWERLNKEYGDDDWSFYHVLHNTYGLNEYQEAVLFEDRSWTYAETRAEVGRLALTFQRIGIGNRTVVGTFINNSPEFYFAWWALFKIGAIPAPLNTSISQEPFRHCLKISQAEYLIYTFELSSTVASSLDIEQGGGCNDNYYPERRLPALKSVFVYDYGTYPKPSLPLDVLVITHSQLAPVTSDMAAWPQEQRPKVASTDLTMLLFTSGTTGLPKAAFVPTGYCHMAANPWRWPVMFQKPRRLYACTPLFHGGATLALLPATVRSGGTVIIARKFSVSKFWQDVRRTRANMLFYIGEMARYLVQAPPDPVHPDETKAHGMEIIYGLGIAAPVWRAFRKRFGVPWISEYYASTEGTGAISFSDHNDVEVGKVAHWGPLMRRFQDTFYIIRIDFESGEVVRDSKSGLCVQAEFGEVGESVTRIQPPLFRSHDYIGEGGKEATDKKLLKDVFKQGDTFWRMGDALSVDSKGYVTFHDRLGDTYRAKGHNISTAEVENAFLHHPHISSANVFAVNMKPYGYDGQLGCVAITLREGASADEPNSTEVEAVRDLEHYLTSKAGLPSYAIPRFLRVLVDLDQEHAAQRDQIGIRDEGGSEYVSLMLKKLKTSLRNEAFSPPSGSRDRLYWIAKEGESFVPLDAITQRQLREGRARL